jgi:hypothetical protein
MRSECIIDELNQKFVADIKWLGHFLFSFPLGRASGIYSFNHHAMIIFIVEFIFSSPKNVADRGTEKFLLPV